MLDFLGVLEIPEKLYGRKKHVARINELFEEVADGASIFQFVEGVSGSGKTSLIKEIQKPLVAKRGYFISGKFDQYNAGKPYDAFITAFKQFVDTLLTEEPRVVEEWKRRILRKLGTNAGVLTAVIPGLELIIGRQPEPKELAPRETENRFKYLLRTFVQLISKADHPLVIFLDDLQWIDNSSLDLIKTLALDNEIDYLFFIGAYRSNEVDDTHPLKITLAELEEKDGVQREHIIVQNLEKSDLASMLKDSFGRDEVTDLCELIHQKTKGNPFFIVQFLENLEEKELVKFDFTAEDWIWDISKIKKENITSNVLELLAAKLSSLSNEELQLLEAASVFGNRFEVNDLEMILGEQFPFYEVLKSCIVEGIIAPIDYKDDTNLSNSYCFIHDKLHQACYELLENEQRAQLHGEIAVFLTDTLSDRQLEKKVFEVAAHINNGQFEQLSDLYKMKFKQINHDASVSAFNSAAYSESIYLAEKALAFETDPWLADFTQTFRSYFLIAEASYLAHDFEKCDDVIQILKQNQRNNNQLVDILGIEIETLKAQSDFAGALDVGVEALTILNEPIPRKPGKPQILMAFVKSKFAIGKRKPAEIEKLPIMEDGSKNRAMTILSNIGLAAFLMEPNMLPVISLKAVLLTLKYGINSFSGHSLAVYGFILGQMGKLDLAREYAELGYRLNEKLDANEMDGKLHMVYNGLINHWDKPLEETTELYLDAYKLGREHGDFEVVYASLILHLENLFFANRSLDNLIEISIKYQGTVDSIQHISAVHHFDVLNALFNSLKNEYVLSNYDEIGDKQKYSDMNDLVGYSKVCLIKGFFKYLQKDYVASRKFFDEAEPLMEKLMGLYHFGVHCFYVSLTLLKELESGDKKAAKKLGKNLKLLKKYAKMNPAEYEHRYLLIASELRRILGKRVELEQYEQVIEIWENKGYIVENAIANELLGSYLLKTGKKKMAMPFIEDAIYDIQKWGATAISDILTQTYAEVATKKVKYAESTRVDATSVSTTSTTSIGNIDLDAVLKASTALSSEIIFDKLLDKLMGFALENAGAQNGYLILRENDELRVEAEKCEGLGISVIENHKELVENPYIAESIVNFVVRTNENVVINDVKRDSRFSMKWDQAQTSPLSILCAPVLNKGELLGVLYLENTITKGAFTPDRVEVLNMLSSQAAVSIQNAKLYNGLEQEVADRTIQIHKQKEIIEEQNREVFSSIRYAKNIQEAILPDAKSLSTYVKDSFVLFRPKDIVSGDYYWFNEKDGKLIIVAADCTGHGVPGAFMSMIGNSLLNRIILENGITEADEILNLLRKYIIEAFRKKEDGTETKDGMDLCMVVIDKETGLMQFAGANNPIYLMRNNELEQYKADRMPIGIPGGELLPFVKHDIQLQKGDIVYMLSDGYPDQFGGPKGKKFSYKRLRNMLLEIQNESFDRQLEILNYEFDQWLGDEEQIDDVTLIGFKYLT